ncbi:MAG: gluconate 2-dehydrogenase subunit 3 family protein [Pseudomonadota bacterium]
MKSPSTTRNLKRRRLLAALAVAGGGGLAASVAAQEKVLSAALAFTPATGGPGLVLSQGELATVRAVGAQVIPTTETPGAVDVDAHGFVDHQLAHCRSADELKQVRAVLARLAARAQAAAQTDFPSLDHASQRELLEQLEASDQRDPFKLLKSLLVLGYCTSEAGATQLLRYLPWPGHYEGSVPYASIGRAWFK